MAHLMDRTIILHYHLFKNAGTSFDGILKWNFPGRWVTAEFPTGPASNTDQVTEWIVSNPQAVAFSSHTASGPLPEIPGVRIISALFLRDPVERIRSAYLFERAQAATAVADSRGVELARRTDLDGYARARIAVRGDRQCRDFHVARLSRFVPGPQPELERAEAALKVLSFVGEVERFGHSIGRFQRLVAPVWPKFSAGSMHLNRAVEKEVAEISPELRVFLEDNNRDDLALLETARRTVWAE
ncbi:MAG: hypothetical protein KF887_16700 [Paracoccaceae bacterium]|nr:MAG: hypothetical protein KF887_16700 [Paracoccaceae bacterium]